MIFRVMALAAVLPVIFCHAASAQFWQQQRTQIQIQYHEAIPAGSDEAQARVAIYTQAQRDCDLAATAFKRRCTISQINFNNNNNNYNCNNNASPGIRVLNANVSMALIDEPASASPKR